MSNNKFLYLLNPKNARDVKGFPFLADLWKEAAMLESLERRKIKRLNHRCTIMLADEHSGYYCYAQLKNLSGDGMYIETEYRFSLVLKSISALITHHLDLLRKNTMLLSNGVSH
jgi:hypothetical protein